MFLGGGASNSGSKPHHTTSDSSDSEDSSSDDTSTDEKPEKLGKSEVEAQNDGDLDSSFSLTKLLQQTVRFNQIFVDCKINSK